MFVSSYDTALEESFRMGIQGLTASQEQILKESLDVLKEEVFERLLSTMKQYLVENLQDEIRQAANNHAVGILESALAGDDETIRNLFGFYSIETRPIFQGRLPKQWALIDAIFKRNPQVFIDQKIAQQQAEIQQLRDDLARHRAYCNANHSDKTNDF